MSAPVILEIEPFAVVAARGLAIARVHGIAGLAVLGLGEGARGCLRRVSLRCAALLVGLLAFEQRIALELGFDEGGELDIGELQQLDRLLQLRRHHQAVALAKLKLCGECHTHSGGAFAWTAPKS